MDLRRIFVDSSNRNQFFLPFPPNGLTNANKWRGLCLSVDKHKFKFTYNSFATSSVLNSSFNVLILHRIEFNTST